MPFARFISEGGQRLDWLKSLKQFLLDLQLMREGEGSKYL